jgi:hypothetical protein
MNNYSQSDFNDDAIVVANNLHLAYNRAKILLARYADGIQAITTDPATQLLMIEVAAFVANCEAAGDFGKTNLDYILDMSSLKLPGDAE